MQTPEDLCEQAQREIASADSTAELRTLELQYLGKSGEITLLSREIGKLAAEHRPAFGQRINETRSAVQVSLDERVASLRKSELALQFEREAIDVTMPARSAGVTTRPGSPPRFALRRSRVLLLACGGECKA